MAYPMQENIDKKQRIKLTRYQQLTFEMREGRLGYNVAISLVLISALSGGIKKRKDELTKLLTKQARTSSKNYSRNAENDTNGQ